MTGKSIWRTEFEKMSVSELNEIMDTLREAVSKKKEPSDPEDVSLNMPYIGKCYSMKDWSGLRYIKVKDLCPQSPLCMECLSFMPEENIDITGKKYYSIDTSMCNIILFEYDESGEKILKENLTEISPQELRNVLGKSLRNIENDYQ